MIMLSSGISPYSVFFNALSILRNWRDIHVMYTIFLQKPI